jgi:hypothetical protein
MVNEITIPKENKAQVEEVRYLENTEQEQKKLDKNQENKSTITESVKKAVVPTVHASDGDDDKDANIEYVDTTKEAIQNDEAEVRRIKGEISDNCDIS